LEKLKYCPHCKSSKGFRISYQIKGYGYEERTFDGKVFNADRNSVDDLEKYCECLECGKLIESEKLNINS
jgi:hypothetical protein